MTGMRTITQRLTNLSAVLLLASWQVVFALSPLFITQTSSALASGLNCVNDTAGANDEPGQKDLTKMCVNYDNVPSTISTTWNWDDLGTSGANTLDACNLFDTNNDGNINYAVCVTTTGNPASIESLTTYSCGNDRVDRCSSPKNVVSSGTTSCTISAQDTDPFPAGDVYPTDIEGSCTIQLSTVGGTDAKLIDVCSYPSQQPNSDPSDCVVFISEPVALVEVIKDVVPDGPGLFNLSVDGPGTDDTTTVNDIGDNGTTGIIALTPPKNGSANATVSEAAGSNTSLTEYAASINCVNRNEGSQVASGSGTSLVVPISDGSNLICTITNTRNTGSLTVNKLLDDNGDGTFETSNPSSFTWSLDGTGTNAMGSTVSGITTGSHSVSENSVTNYHFVGWYLTADTQHSCANPTGTTLPVSTSITTNATASVTLCNARDTGTVTVRKELNPTTDKGVFDLYVGETLVKENASNGQSGSLQVPTGSYTVAELAGDNTSLSDYASSYVCTNDNEQTVASEGTVTSTSFAVSSGDSITCVFTNTKLGSVKVTKYNDLDRDGTPTSQVNGQTVQDPTLPGWVITLSGFDNQTTGTDGSTTFANVKSGRYLLDEILKDGWTQRNIHCNDLDQEVGEVVSEDGYVVSVEPGANVECFIGNFQALALNLIKTNNRPAPTVVGDTVTYTLTASLPTTSGASFNSFVSDLPPEGFVYVPGSWTASVKHLDGTTQDLKENGTTPEPGYGSPGTWLLGTLLPGDIVTLTYRATIQNSVNAGTYPDLAFASGCDLPTAACSGGTVVYSNIASGANDPFVGTNVTVTVPQVLGASTTRTILVNTGTETTLIQIFAGLIMAFALALAMRTHYSAKGGRS